jgi:formate dehydrogenase subunit beta
MTKVLSIGKSAHDGLKELLKFLLEKDKVRGIITLRKTADDGAISYSLITNPEDVESTVPLFPLMPVSLAKQLSRLTLVEAATEPIAVVLRPCELRAFVELLKRSQGSLDNILFISSTCGGVYPLEMAVEGNKGNAWWKVYQESSARESWVRRQSNKYGARERPRKRDSVTKPN